MRVEQMRRESEPRETPILALRPRMKRLLERVAGVGRIVNVARSQRPLLEMLQDQIRQVHGFAPLQTHRPRHLRGEGRKRQKISGRSTSGSGSAWRLPGRGRAS